MRTEDGHIISKCLDGDSAAFGLLVDKYKSGVYALAYSKLRNFHDAEDVTQEVFIKAYEKLRSLKRWDSFLAWLYAITSNHCKMLIRARSRRTDREYTQDQSPATLVDLSISSYRDELAYESVHRALDSLPEGYRQVLSLHYLGGMDSNEIARFLGISPSNVRQRLSRARSRLGEEMRAMMSTNLEARKLPATFTFRIVEAVKRINIRPIPRSPGLSWGMSLAAGLLITILSLGPNPSLLDNIGSSSSLSSPDEARILSVGEFPVDVLNASEMVFISGQHESGNNGGKSGDTGPQKAPLKAANDGAEFVSAWPEEILGLRFPYDVAVDSSGGIYVADGNDCIQKFDSNGKFLMKWGTQGAGDGEFKDSSSITIDSAGNVYVADTGNHRVQKFDSNGKFLMKWGTEGAGDGQFKNPGSITINGDGNIYVVDNSNRRIQKFDSSGKFLIKWGIEGFGSRFVTWPNGIAIDGAGNIYVVDNSECCIRKLSSDGKLLIKWGAEGAGNGQFEWPRDVAIDSAGNVYVVDTYNYRIQKFDSNGKFLMKWGTEGAGDSEFEAPYGITIESDGSIYVADYANHRIQKFDSEGKLLIKFGDEGASDGQFQSPVGLAIGSSGDIYVIDRDSHRIQKFDSDGKLLMKWGSYGSGNGQFKRPYGIAIDSDGNIYVADTENYRVQKFDPEGKLLKNWGSLGQRDGQFGFIYGIATDSDKYVYVTDASSNRVHKFDSNGKFLLKWGSQGQAAGQFQWPWGIAVDRSGDVYVVDRSNHRVQKFDSKGNFLLTWGTQGSGDGQFSFPYGITTDSDGNVYVCDSYNHRIQRFDSKGNFLTKWGTYGTGDMEFGVPFDIAVSSSGYIYVADNYRVKVYRLIGGRIVEPGGKQLGKWGGVKRTALLQNYPNPFNPDTWIPFNLSHQENVTIRIYNSTGQLVRKLGLGDKMPGAYLSREKAAYWDGRNEAGETVASDVYFYVMEAGEGITDLRKMVMTR